VTTVNGKRARSQRLVAAITAKTLFVPRLFIVEDATFGQRFPTMGAALGMQILIAVGAVEFVILWNETAGSNSLFTHGAFETLLMPVGPIVLQASAS